MEEELDAFEILYYASLIRLIFEKIHPFQDGKRKLTRLLEKWLLIQKFGVVAMAIQLQKNYFIHLYDYYKNLEILGLNYDSFNYSKALPFLLMTTIGLRNQWPFELIKLK